MKIGGTGAGDDSGFSFAIVLYGRVQFPWAVNVALGGMGEFDASCASGAAVVLGEVALCAVAAGGKFFFAEVGMVSVRLASVALGGAGLNEVWVEAAEFGADGDAAAA